VKEGFGIKMPIQNAPLSSSMSFYFYGMTTAPVVIGRISLKLVDIINSD